MPDPERGPIESLNPRSPPIEEVTQHEVSSAVAVAGHPLHAIALVIATLGIDVFYWFFGDPFFLRAGVAMTLLAIAGANWGLRLAAPEQVLPHGLALSVLAAIFTGLAGWHDGKLVFHHGIGLMVDAGK